MKTLTKIALAAATSLLLNSNAMALSFDGLAGQTVKLSNGLYGTTNGGEFIIDVQGKGTTQDYISFCLERNEYINYTETFTIKNVSDSAESGGIGGAVNGIDKVDNKTKWVFWNYLQGTFGKGDDVANAVQTAIWVFENELDSLGNYATTVYEWLKKADNNFSITGDVRVLNLTFQNGENAQSQLVAAPVPEPTTMLLFGTGLIGLAGIARRRQNA